MDNEIVSKSDQNASEVKLILAEIRKRFPVFAQFQPLKIGIHRDIHRQMPEFSQRLLCSAIKRHTKDKRYLRNVAKGGSRFDLDSTPNGVVPPEHQKRAEVLLKRIILCYQENNKRLEQKIPETRKKFVARVVRIIRTPLA